jgi:hypothetical protein
MTLMDKAVDHGDFVDNVSLTSNICLFCNRYFGAIELDEEFF